MTQEDVSQGAKNDDAEAVLRKFLNPALKGKAWDALIAAFAVGDQYNWDNAKAAFDQLFKSTASGMYLDRKNGDDGLKRPANIGIGDELYRQLGIKVTNAKLTEQVILEILEVFYGSDSLRGHIDTGTFEPYALNDGDTLALNVDGVDLPTLTFRETEFSIIGQATALEVATSITRQLGMVGSTAFASVVKDPVTGTAGVRIYSGALGLISSVQVTGGLAQKALRLEQQVVTPPIGTDPATLTWNLSVPEAGSLVLKVSGTSALDMNQLQVGDYILVTGENFDPANRGGFPITAIDIEYVGATYTQTLTVANNAAVAQTSVTQASLDDVLFFRPVVKAIHAGGTRTVVVSQPDSGAVDVVIPATTQAVNREPGSGAYILDTDPLAGAQVTRTGTTATITTSAPHGLIVGQQVSVEEAFAVQGPTIHAGSSGLTSASLGTLWGILDAPHTATSRTATKLADGQVLLVGGANPAQLFTIGGSSVLADGAVQFTYAWADSGSPTDPRSLHTASLLNSGSVFVAGGAGSGGSSTPTLQSLDQTAPPGTIGVDVIQVPQFQADYDNQNAGKVLFLTSGGGVVVHPDGSLTVVTPPAGSYDRFTGLGCPLDSSKAFLLLRGAVNTEYNAFYFDWATETFTAATDPVARSPDDGDGVFSCCRLADGRVLVVYGPYDSGTSSTPCYIFDPAGNSGAGSWSSTANYPGPYSNSWSPLVLLDDGDVLDPGLGHDTGSTRYNPASGTWTLLTSGPDQLWSYYSDVNISLIRLHSGKVALGISAAYISVFDPATDTWTDQPIWEQDGQYNETWMVEYEPDKLFVHGTKNDNTGAAIALYDIGTQTWTDLTFGPAATFPILKNGGWRSAGKWFGVNTGTPLAQAEFSFSSGSSSLATTEVWADGTWTAGPDLVVARQHHQAQVLSDGRVLVFGGDDGTNPLASTELFDGTTIAAGPAMATPRSNFTSIVLADGQVLAIGGDDLASCEVFDGAAWHATGSMTYARANAAAALLPDGRVLVTGGTGRVATRQDAAADLATAEIYDPSTGRWSPAGKLRAPLSGHSMAWSKDKLVVGSQYFDPATGKFTTIPGVKSAIEPLAVQVQDGLVLAVGESAADLLVQANDSLTAGGLNGVFRIDSTPTPTSLTYKTPNVSAYSSSIATVRAMAAAPAPAGFKGPFVLDTKSDVAITGVETTSTQDLFKGQQYTSLKVTDATAFPDAEGYLVIGYGTETVSYPIHYLGRISDTELLLDFQQKMPATNLAGASITLLSGKAGLTSVDDPGGTGLFYATDSGAGRTAAQEQLKSVIATGIDLNLEVVYPGDKGLGKSSSDWVWSGEES